LSFFIPSSTSTVAKQLAYFHQQTSS